MRIAKSYEKQSKLLFYVKKNKPCVCKHCLLVNGWRNGCLNASNVAETIQRRVKIAKSCEKQSKQKNEKIFRL